MIVLNRGARVPNRLLEVAEHQTEELIRAFDEQREIRPNNSVYGHNSVKSLLLELQKNKCAFCETKLTNQFGNVEHFRPKGRWQARRGEEPISPGYFWMSYDWNNLLLSCEVCNIRYKRDFFPLKDETKRANPSSRDVSAEEPLLLDPYLEDPQMHLKFDLWNIYSIDDSIQGSTSILGFGLDSEELDEARRDRLNGVRLVLENLENLLERTVPHDLLVAVRDAGDFLLKAIAPEGEYSAMIRDNFGVRIGFALEAIEELS